MSPGSLLAPLLERAEEDREGQNEGDDKERGDDHDGYDAKIAQQAPHGTGLATRMTNSADDRSPRARLAGA